MSEIEKLEANVELKSDANKVWEAIKDSHTLFPKAIPHLLKSVEIVEGVDHVVGSVKLVTFGEGNNPVATTKERLDMVDEETKTLAYSMVDDHDVPFYKGFKAQVVVEERDEGSLVKWSCEHEKPKEGGHVPPISPQGVKEFAIGIFKDLDEYLLKAN